MFQAVAVPNVLTDLVNTFREETRTIQYFTIDPAKLPKLAEPDEAQMKEVYGAQQRRFVTPGVPPPRRTHPLDGRGQEVARHQGRRGA